MKIRVARAKDYENVISLMQQLNPKDAEIKETTGRKIFHSILENDGLTIFLAEVDNEVVASCYLNIVPNLTRSARPYALIENVVTHASHRRQGIGRRLMSHVLSTASDRGCYKVMLLTGGNHAVQAFYESCGMDRHSKTAFICRF